MSGLGAIAGGAGGTALGGPVGGVIGTTVGGVLDGMFNGDDPAEFWKQLDQNDYQAQKYYQWCEKFAPGIVVSGDVWEAQAGAQSIDSFRDKWIENLNRVKASGTVIGAGQMAEFAAMDQGGFDANMIWHPPDSMATESNGTTGSGGSGDGGKKNIDLSGFIMLWPWQKGIWTKPSPVMWYHWVLWVLMLITGIVLLRWLFMPKRRRSGRRRALRRRARRMKRSRSRSRTMR